MSDQTQIAADGALEKPEDAGTGVSGVVKRWLMECKIAEDAEKDWREDAKKTLKVYRGNGLPGFGSDQRTGKRKDTFNILWANTETMRPALYNSVPRPDIRRKFRDKDPIGKVVSELLQRCVTFSIDDGFNEVMIAAVNDMLLQGRAVTRVKYIPSFKEPDEETDGNDEGDLAYEEVKCEQVSWDKFLVGPGRRWEQVPWIRFEHQLTKTEIEDRFPKYSEKVQYDTDVDADLSDDDKTIFKRVTVWEIWDKDKREVIFISPSYKVSPLSTTPDPLKLQRFWPIPEPLRAIEDPDSLVPIPEYTQYHTLAMELENVTNRIKGIIKGLRLRGIYDSRIGELAKIFESGDNVMLPAENVAAILEAGGVDKAIWMTPVDRHSEVLLRLYEYRQGLMSAIYEITGISDIIRGQTQANETLGAQELKANYGSQRMQRKQVAIQNYARDLIRIMVEIIAERFSPTTIGLMSGMEFPTQQQKVQLQQQLSASGGQEIPEEIQEMLDKPTVEELEKVLRSDILREYKIDVETNSTVQNQLKDEKQSIVELLSSITEYVNGIAPMVAQGAFPAETAKQLLLAAVRRFDLGTVVEDTLEDIGEEGQGNGQAQIQQMQEQMESERQEMQDKVTELSKLGEQQIKETESDLTKKATQQVAFMDEKKRLDIKALTDESKLAIDKLNLEADERELQHQKQLFKLEMENKQAIFKMQQQASGAVPTEQSISADKERGTRMSDVVTRLSKAAGKLTGARESSLQRDDAGSIQGSRSN